MPVPFGRGARSNRKRTLKRKEFIIGAVAGLLVAVIATAGGLIRWPGMEGSLLSVNGPITPSAGAPGAAFGPPPGAPVSFADIFNQVAPAVVQIDVRTRIARPSTNGMQIPGLPFDFQVPEGEGGDEEGETAMGAGSGFFISPDGYIVTNNHVIANAEEITVRLANNRVLPARLVGRDESTDLAVIKVEGGNYPYVSFEESAEPRVGDWVIAVGNPFGLGGTATAGIVSAKSRDLRDASSNYIDYIQIDAAINRGNSGGPTFDIYGRVIGVNTAIFSPTGGSIGIGFAIPAETAKAITDRLMRGEQIERGYLGVQIADLEPYREALGLDAGMQGAMVIEVTPGGPAARGGLRPGDIVVEMNELPVVDATDLTRRVGAAAVNETLEVVVLRGERRLVARVKAARRPSLEELNAPVPQRPAGAPSEGVRIGALTLAPMSPDLRRKYDIPAGVDGLVIVANGRIGDSPLRPGMVVMQAGLKPARALADVEAELARAREAGRDEIFLLVWSAGGNGALLMDVPARAAARPRTPATTQ
ncbi:trypsin-like peptidase domain-containing protein [Brevundimonas sp. A19_0]|nr:trypsin-like peptidase domain-containing protein [Brevundimonas sp. A19_0]